MSKAIRSVMTLLVVGAGLVAAPVEAKNHDGLGGDFYVEAFDAGGYYFRVEGLKDRNPEIVLPPGEAVRVEIRNVAHEFHNIHFGDPLNARTGLLQPGENAIIDVEVPADASGETAYWCDPHRRVGMLGTVTFDPEAGAGAEESVPPMAAVAVILTLAVLAFGVRARQRA